MNTNMTKQLSLFGFFAITASMVMTVYEYPAFATSGFTLVFFLLFAGILWFIPVALCSAEMATVEGWQTGGVFTWVSETLGERWGFAAIFFQWFQISVGFITMLYFIVGSLSYVFDWSALNDNTMLKFIAIMVVFWLLTFLQFGGTTYTARIAKMGFIFGILIPAIILFCLSIAYIVGGNPINVEISAKTFFPDLSNINSLVILVSFILSYMGIEASATHANEMANPRRDYPIAIIILVFLAIALSTIGGLSVAAVIPQSELNLSSGVNQTFEALILHFGSDLKWVVRIIAAAIGFGVMAEVSAWVVGPSKGIFAAAKRGLLPKSLSKVNENNVPVPLILVQGVIVSIWGAVLTFGGGGNNLSFLTAISLTVVIYIAMYLIFFIAYLALLFKKKDLKRTYEVPGGLVGKVIIAVVGFAVSLFSLIISFFPPSQIMKSNEGEYETILIISFVVVIVLPFIIYSFKSKFGGVVDEMEAMPKMTNPTSSNPNNNNNNK